MNVNLSFVFAGCKPQGVSVLRALNRAGFCPALIIIPNELPEEDIHMMQSVAGECNAPCYASNQLESFMDKLQQVDVLVTCRYPIVPETVFCAPRLGAINIHSSLLPHYRGVHPLSWALIRGETKTGVTVHHINAGIDTGAIIKQKPLFIHKQQDFWGLSKEVDKISAELMVEVFKDIEEKGEIAVGIPQKGKHFYARRRTPDDSQVDWALTADALLNLSRALPPPLPAPFSFLLNGQKITLSILRSVKRYSEPQPVGTVLERVGSMRYIIQCGNANAVEIEVSLALEVGTRLMVKN